MNTSTSNSNLKRKTHVLNQKEREVNKNVFLIYNLTRDDFETDEEFDDFLEERETIIYNLVHDENSSEATIKMNEFKKNHFALIEKRNAQNFDKSKGYQQIQTLPLLGQRKYQTKVLQANSTRLVMTNVNYSNDGFLTDINKRQEEWKENEKIPIGIVGGLPDELFLIKAKEELNNTFFINQ